MFFKSALLTKDDVVNVFQHICGKDQVWDNSGDLFSYTRDQTMDFSFSFDILVKPGSAEEIAAVLKVCNKYKIPVTPRGGGSGVTGGALPVQGGVLLSLDRLNKIISVDTINHYVMAESGVVTADLCAAVSGAGLFFPVQPGSGAYSLVGGNVAENAGSIASCKYGVTGNYVLNLEVVLPNGEIIWTGANVSKNVTGLNLTQLFVGSEGVLGIITKVVYRVLPAPAPEKLLLAAFSSLEKASAAITAIRRQPLIPSAVELICRNAIELVTPHLDGAKPFIPKQAEALLIVGVEEETNRDEALFAIAELLQPFAGEEIYVTDSAGKKEAILQIRSSIGKALTHNGAQYRDVDACVPLSFLYSFIRKAEEICRRHHVPMVCFGHALDGNMHTMLLLKSNEIVSLNGRVNTAITELYTCAVENGGVISGEHGIGFLQKEFLGIQFSEPYLALLRGIKHLFDPNNILNPGKIF